MIKKLIKKSLMLSALIILAVYTVSSIRFGNWSETLMLGELVLISGLLSISQLLLERFKSEYYLIEVLVEYIMVCLIVGLLGLGFQWFRLSYLWHVFLYVTPVYLIGYFLDLGRTKRDIDFINEKIKKRAERGNNHGDGNDNGKRCQ